MGSSRRVLAWPVNAQSIMEPAVIDDPAPVLAPAADIDKTAPPADLVGQIGGSGVDSLGDGLIETARGHYQLGVLGGQRYRVGAVERAVGVDLVHHREGHRENRRSIARQLQV